jgi:fluoride exporter
VSSQRDSHSELPLDPDTDDIEVVPRPLHLRPAAVGLVALGGAIGTGVRLVVSAAIPVEWGIPFGILVINVTGAFVLGLLLEVLVRRGDDTGVRRGIRLFVGTGVLGGYTTYSTFAVGAEGLLHTDLTASLLYGALTVVVGGAASLLGIAAGAALTRGRRA